MSFGKASYVLSQALNSRAGDCEVEVPDEIHELVRPSGYVHREPSYTWQQEQRDYDEIGLVAIPRLNFSLGPEELQAFCKPYTHVNHTGLVLTKFRRFASCAPISYPLCG